MSCLDNAHLISAAHVVVLPPFDVLKASFDMTTLSEPSAYLTSSLLIVVFSHQPSPPAMCHAFLIINSK